MTTVITRAEILAGVALLPAGARRDRLQSVATTALDTLGACLPLGPRERGGECGHRGDPALHGTAHRRGTDVLIAAIARVSGSPVATETPRTSTASGCTSSIHGHRTSVMPARFVVSQGR